MKNLWKLVGHAQNLSKFTCPAEQWQVAIYCLVMSKCTFTLYVTKNKTAGNLFATHKVSLKTSLKFFNHIETAKNLQTRQARGLILRSLGFALG